MSCRFWARHLLNRGKRTPPRAVASSRRMSRDSAQRRCRDQRKLGKPGRQSWMGAQKHSQNFFVQFLYRYPGFDAFDDFNNIVESIGCEISECCQVRGSNPCRGANSLVTDSSGGSYWYSSNFRSESNLSFRREPVLLPNFRIARDPSGATD